MSAPSDGARADARKARLGKVDAPKDVEAVAWMIHRACGCSDTDIGFNGPIQLGGPCPPDREDYEGARDIVASDWFAGVIADAKAEALREAADALLLAPISFGRPSACAWLRDRAESGR